MMMRCRRASHAFSSEVVISRCAGAAALNVLSSAFLYGNRQTIMQRVAVLDLPMGVTVPEALLVRADKVIE
jgi:hypothetical protein